MINEVQYQRFEDLATQWEEVGEMSGHNCADSLRRLISEFKNVDKFIRDNNLSTSNDMYEDPYKDEDIDEGGTWH